MEKRKYGNTNVYLSVVGFGGVIVMNKHDETVFANESQEEANRVVAKAIDRGINYFDVAPAYGDAEERLGWALEPYRDSVFLACKTIKRTKKEAEEELYRSLKRLRTDYFDLYQLHSVNTIEEINQIFSENGAIEALIEAREKGLIKYIGFSSHSEDAALELLDRFKFDSVLFPINWVCWYQGNFGPRLVKKAMDKGVAILAMKSLVKRGLREGERKKWPKCPYLPVENFDEVLLAVRFTLSLPVTSAVSPAHAELLWLMCDAAENFYPLSENEKKEIENRSKGIEPMFPLKGPVNWWSL
ncbi:MAG: aldo/keto reductase [Nitrososphaeria archaeon]|nr:aldo/keto reductase [Nitrososphaeria archaeon]